MDDLDLEKLKQELDDVSGGSQYDVDSIMREAGIAAPEQDKEDLERLMNQFGIRLDSTDEQSTMPLSQAAETVTQALEPEAKTVDLSALSRASEQTLQLTQEQDDLAAAQSTEPADPLSEQDDVFAKLFARLGEIEEDSSGDAVHPEGHTQTEWVDPRIPPLSEPEEEPDLMARLFDDADATQKLETEDFTQQMDEVSAGSFAEEIEPETQRMADEPENTADAQPKEEQSAETPKKGFWSRLFSIDDEEEKEFEEEAEELDARTQRIQPAAETETEEIAESDDDAEEETDEEDEAPKKGFWSRLFGGDDEEDDLDDEDEELGESAEAEEPTQVLTELLTEDEPTDLIESAAENEIEEPAESDDDAEDEADEEDEAPKKGFWSRLFGGDDEEDDLDEEDEELDESEEEEPTQVLPELLTEDEPTQLIESVAQSEIEETAESDEDAEDESDEEDGVLKKGFWSRLFGGEDEEDDLDDEDEELDESAEAEEPTQVLTEPLTEDEPTEIIESAAENEIEETAESEEDAEEETDEEDEAPKKGFWSRLFGGEDEEDDLDDEDEELDESDEAEEPTQVLTEPLTEEEPTEVIESAAQSEIEETADSEEDVEEETDKEDEAPKKGFWSRLFGGDDEEDDLDEEDEELDESEEEEPTQVLPEPLTEDEPTEDIESAEETEAEETEESDDDTVEEMSEEAAAPAPQPRPEDTPVISEEELEAFLSDVEKDEESEPHVSFEQILRDNGVEPEEEPQPQKISLEQFPDKETTVYFDIPVRNAAQEEQPHAPELFDAEAALAEDEKHRQTETEKASEQTEAQPQNPEWMEMSLEELMTVAPPLAQLRKDGPVMQREVARQREWIAERRRAYMQAQQPAAESDDGLSEDDTDDMPHGPGESDDTREGRGSVFPDRSDGESEIDPADRETEQTDEPEEVTAAPEQEEQPEQSGAEQMTAEQPEHKDRKKRNTHGVWPAEQPPRDLRKASKDWRQRARAQAQRSILVAICAIFASYISCAEDFSLPLPEVLNYVDNPRTVLFVFVGLLLAAMLIAYDILIEGVRALLHRSPNFCTLVDLALLLNLVHCVVRLVWEGEEMPYVCVVLLALFAQMRARVSEYSARHYTYKVAANAKQPAGLYCHDGEPVHVVEQPMAGTEDFVQQTVLPDDSRRAEGILTVLAAVLSVVLSAVVCTATGDAGRISYVLAATMTGACQIALLCALPMAHHHAARRMAKSGAAEDGLRGARAIARANTVVLTDEDLFPTGSIALEHLELHSKLSDTTALAYAAALAGQSSLGRLLAEEVRTRYGTPLTAHHVVRDVSGGISGNIGGLDILLGNAEFLKSRGVPAGELPDNALALSVEGAMAAVLTFDYRVSAAQFNAMQLLMERHRGILLHTRNQQVTPKLVEQLYRLSEGTVVLPELEMDRALRSANYTRGDAPRGLLLRSGLVPLADCVTTAQTHARLAVIGAVIGVGAALLCMLLMAYMCYVFVPLDARPIRMLLYAALCFIPVFFIENGVGRE